jgi:tetratricopeptide (TPR) repeat protein
MINAALDMKRFQPNRILLALSLLPVLFAGLPLGARSDRPDAAELLRQGNDWLDLGRYEQAEEVFSRLVELDSESAQAYGGLGRAQALNRRWLRAEESLRRARALGQSDLRTMVYLGSALWENTKYEEAAEIYQEAIKLFPGSPLAKYQLGRLRLWQGRYEDAVGLLRQAAARNPAPDVLLDLAEALRGAGEIDDAIVAYQQVTRKAPDLMKAHYGLALLLEQKGESEQAKRHLSAYQELYREDQAAARSSELEKGEISRGRELMRKNQISQAIDHLSSLPPSIDTLTVLAEAYALADEPGKAIESLERAVVMDPGNAELRRRLSEARLATDSEHG